MPLRHNARYIEHYAYAAHSRVMSLHMAFCMLKYFAGRAESAARILLSLIFVLVFIYLVIFSGNIVAFAFGFNTFFGKKSVNNKNDAGNKDKSGSGNI